MANSFMVIFIVTIVGIRISLFLHPQAGMTIGSVRVHHYMWGLAGAPIAVALHLVPLLAISIALVIDEVTFICIGGRTHEDNYSTTSLLGTVVLSVAVCLLRKWLVGLI
jgi:hypothetical protein